jgi:hypothetical protein
MQSFPHMKVEPGCMELSGGDALPLEIRRQGALQTVILGHLMAKGAAAVADEDARLRPSPASGSDLLGHAL